MQYNSYEAADFAADESFVAYFLKKDADAEAFWQHWLAAHPEKSNEVKAAERLLTQLYLRLDEAEIEMEVAKFDEFLKGPATIDTVPIQRKIFSSFNYLKIVAAAAVVVLVALLSITTYQQRNVTPIYITKRNTFGHKSIIVLSDGSKVTLNSNSTLTFQKNFEGETRSVELIGEAFFEVAHQPDKPFIVKTGKLFTKVLGTKFDVCAYPNLSTIKVSLLQGSVALNIDGSNKKLKLKPAQMAVFNPKANSLLQTTFDTSAALAWQKGTVTFNNSAFDEIAAQLYNAYGITLVNKSGEQQWNYTGSFQKANYIDIVKSICFAKGLNYQLTQKTITIIK
ncbi:FecR family protein [Nubsella zeaxanthinifaciens]|jgi:transmembrane sensor|uniref:FecR family protein n=1 Tax=Nubsella zeaxanthinifaciens TaxID=392412 RepID=UPI000DE2294B|nr:FecR family protein [Nubsella zeaxanthinifaciens]